MLIYDIEGLCPDASGASQYCYVFDVQVQKVAMLDVRPGKGTLPGLRKSVQEAAATP